jgi:hypothetical protein
MAIITPLNRENDQTQTTYTIPVPDQLFMRPKPFAIHVGVSYNKVLEWIADGMPVVPENKNPYLIITPAAIEWLRKKFGF